MGVAVLGVIIEQVSGVSLAEYTRERIFRPLGMNRTSWRLAEYCSPDEIARGVEWDGSQFVDDDNGTQGQPEGHPEIASGMLRTTSSDFIRFAMAIGNGGELDGARILESATVEEMLTRQLGPEVATCPDGRSDASRQAMLWHRIQDRFGNDWAGHYGGVNGASTALWLVPGDAVRYVILTNQAGIETVGAVEAALLANITPLLE
jgi:CubicO group peptidase (beta-lactamase class C family)